LNQAEATSSLRRAGRRTAGWGEKGYMRIAMSGPHGPPQQPCCVACQSSYPTVAK
jgi:hypothetical protein